MAKIDKKMKKKLIQDVVDILEVEELGHILQHKITELKILASMGIDQYKTGESPKTNSLLSLSDHFPGTDFELHRIGEKLWIPSIPDEPGIGNIFEIIPMEMLNFIEKYIEDKEALFMGRGIRLAGQPNKLFDLAFEKDGSHHISGIINTREDKNPGIPAVNEPVECLPGDIFENMDEIEMFKLMLEYLVANKDYFTYMSNEFLLRWKPLIDENLVLTTKI